MKISFDYYTKQSDKALAAYRLTVEASSGTGCSADLRYDAEDKIHNIMGTLEHTAIAELFELFETGGFSEDRYELDED